MQPIGPSFQSHWPEPVVTKVVVLSSGDYGAAAGETPSNFTRTLPWRIYDVLAIKLVTLDIAFQKADATPPNPTGLYLGINGIRHVMSSDPRIDESFAYVTPLPTNSFANETVRHYTFNNTAGGIDDPYTYFYMPATSSLEKMNITLKNADGTPYDTADTTVTVTLLVYTRFSKLTRL